MCSPQPLIPRASVWECVRLASCCKRPESADGHPDKPDPALAPPEYQRIADASTRLRSKSLVWNGPIPGCQVRLVASWRATSSAIFPQPTSERRCWTCLRAIPGVLFVSLRCPSQMEVERLRIARCFRIRSAAASFDRWPSRSDSLLQKMGIRAGLEPFDIMICFHDGQIGALDAPRDFLTGDTRIGHERDFPILAVKL